ncbi:hypothetical protein COO91_03023 [Nostoc flagelliforme CCNUN1]|uniref:Uncharacterized protein n=1 Tax=Nostoc flagelliforme CCNUN1 TaxID=2038116 RepID=A0A2K8SNU3_9NOSO|nr:hypothetical protein COO91_03023 [Nostoc flagelliforme CCNUN1]
MLCVAVHLVTLQLVALVAHYPKWSSQSDRALALNNFINK